MAENQRLFVIGGGSSGMMAALSAARRGPAVILLERKDRVGRKLLATGNGRCNLTNIDSSLSRFHGGDSAFIAAVLSRLPAASVIDFFEELGISCQAEGEGRIYPRSDQASAVLDVLRWELERLQVEVRTGHEVRAIVRKGRGFALQLAAGGELRAERVVLACGGMAGPQFGSDGSGLRLAAALGHRLVDPVAALVPLRLRTDFLRKLKGVSFAAYGEVRCGNEVLRGEQGEFLFTDSGISGPPVLQLSGTAARALKANKEPCIVLDLFPAMSLEELAFALEVRFRCQGHKSIADGLVGLLHKRLIPVILSAAGIDDHSLPGAAITAAARLGLARILKGWSLPVSGTMPWPEAQVTAGGIALDEVNPETLESRIVPGLFFCGEILDVDGDCGGFNLQWAWSSGWLAGLSAAGR
ncbi:MAG: NAD(P)/FAD-dependent oxidoreductase [Candidatus Aminicenantes bacterium]|nr:NAD(P)/FAD-dependent oxidoreductase [Candidatus Aminicenantes bacterium]